MTFKGVKLVSAPITQISVFRSVQMLEETSVSNSVESTRHGRKVLVGFRQGLNYLSNLANRLDQFAGENQMPGCKDLASLCRALVQSFQKARLTESEYVLFHQDFAKIEAQLGRKLTARSLVGSVRLFDQLAELRSLQAPTFSNNPWLLVEVKAKN